MHNSSPQKILDPISIPKIAGSPDSLDTATTADTSESQPEIQSFKDVKDIGPIRAFPHFRDAIGA